jgi:hypothetical protein
MPLLKSTRRATSVLRLAAAAHGGALGEWVRDLILRELGGARPAIHRQRRFLGFASW